MTALNQYIRLETIGHWRATADAAPREVMVVLGDATLVLKDFQEHPLAHWSLPTVRRLNPGENPAIFSPDMDGAETLEIDDDTMTDALTLVDTVVHRAPRSGRLRYIALGAVVLATVFGAIFWLPGALRQNAMNVLPETKRVEFGTSTLAAMRDHTGSPCRNAAALPAMRRFTERLSKEGATLRLVVVPNDTPHVYALPGDVYVIGRNLIEAVDDPLVPAGALLVAKAGTEKEEPLEALITSSGLFSTLGLLSSGNLPEQAFADYAAELTTAPMPPVDVEATMRAFEGAQISARPYAYALNETGTDALDLIEEADLADYAERPILSDSDWVALQSICDS